MSTSRLQQLRHQNIQLQQRIATLKTQTSANNLQGQIHRFIQQSKKNLNSMQNQIAQENAKQNQLLHSATANYENILKRQIELLNQNKQLSQQKQQQDRILNQEVQKMTQEYQNQIKSFEKKVKANVKKIQEVSNGGNMIAKLIANPRFRQAMQQRGCSLQALQNQSKLEQVSQEVEERQKQIEEAEQKSARLDEQLMKMHELIDTMKSLLENMMKQKENILKQNVVLKEKLKQSQALITKLLGSQPVEEEEEEEQQQDIEAEKQEDNQGEESNKA